MAISTQRKQATKNLQNQGKHEICAELCVEGYQLSAFGIVEGIDFFASHPASRVLRALHVETSTAQVNESGSVGEFSVSKRLIKEETHFAVWFAFVLVLGDEFRFVVVPREEMQRFLQSKERLCPSESNTLCFQLFFDGEGEVFSCGHRFTPFQGLQHLFLPVHIAA